MKKNEKRVTPKQFIKAWKTSKNLKEVCDKTKLSYRATRFRAFHYRKMGVKLQALMNSNYDCAVYDWDELIRYAKSFDE